MRPCVGATSCRHRVCRGEPFVAHMRYIAVPAPLMARSAISERRSDPIGRFANMSIAYSFGRGFGRHPRPAQGVGSTTRGTPRSSSKRAPSPRHTRARRLFALCRTRHARFSEHMGLCGVLEPLSPSATRRARLGLACLRLSWRNSREARVVLMECMADVLLVDLRAAGRGCARRPAHVQLGRACMHAVLRRGNAAGILGIVVDLSRTTCLVAHSGSELRSVWLRRRLLSIFLLRAPSTMRGHSTLFLSCPRLRGIIGGDEKGGESKNGSQRRKCPPSERVAARARLSVVVFVLVVCSRRTWPSRRAALLRLRVYEPGISRSFMPRCPHQRFAQESIVYNTLLDGCTRHNRMDLVDSVIEYIDRDKAGRDIFAHRHAYLLAHALASANMRCFSRVCKHAPFTQATCLMGVLFSQYAHLQRRRPPKAAGSPALCVFNQHAHMYMRICMGICVYIDTCLCSYGRRYI